MKLDYNKLVLKVDTYLRDKRSTKRSWEILLPEKLFNPDLWLWESRGVATGSAWGIFWALSPVPMQTVFAILSTIGTRGNVPMSVLTCWISLPGFQVLLWPFQWWVGAKILGVFGISSGVNMEMISSAAEAAPHGLQAMLDILGSINPWLLGGELLFGCGLTCCCAAAFIYTLIRLVWRITKD